ncbi:potassium channel family protein [Bacillus sp. 2205SS5-2]|uniref:potassium channel family protein n=1 Tax=Bacillus sp. 2205SS5-2 TaxID=3109031 RepID=UPI003007956D
MLYIIGMIIIILMFASLRTLFTPTETRAHHISLHHFLFLAIVYVIFMLGFALLYLIVEMKGISILLENGHNLKGDYSHQFFTSLYFSGVTLFSLGYGDVSPIGIGRAIALVESLLGYIIPAAFVVRTVLNLDKS